LNAAPDLCERGSRACAIARGLAVVGSFLAAVQAEGCSAREARLAFSPCMSTNEVIDCSVGFDPAGAVLENLGEADSRIGFWHEVRLVHQGETLLSFHDSEGFFGLSGGRITEYFQVESRRHTRQELFAVLRDAMDRLERAGFVERSGNRDSLLAVTAISDLRSIAFERGDYQVWFSVEFDSNDGDRFQFGARSVGACRAPELHRWLQDNDPLYSRP